MLEGRGNGAGDWNRGSKHLPATATLLILYSICLHTCSMLSGMDNLGEMSLWIRYTRQILSCEGIFIGAMFFEILRVEDHGQPQLVSQG